MPSQPFSMADVFSSKRRELLATLLVLAGLIVPWMSPLHPAPLADWFTDTLTLSFIALAALVPLSAQREKVLTRAGLLAWAMVTVVAILSFVHKPTYTAQIWLPAGTFVAMVLLAGVIRDLVSSPDARSRFLDMLAWALLLSAVVQSLIGLAQYTGIANHFGFWMVHNPNATSSFVMGNISQRNVFAHMLALGVVSACWLYSRGRLHLAVLAFLVAFIGLIQAWCGARLVLAYGAGLMVLALWWWLRARQDESVRRFCHAAWLAGALVLGMQWMGLWIAQGLWNGFGIGAVGDSGYARLFDVGPTQRRWAEWAKALEGFSSHPFFGLGWGGLAANSVYVEAFGNYVKSADDTLCMHAHNLVIQLLAETGLFGTLVALGGILWCLWPALRRASVESVFLLGLAMVTLTHSQFEYPLWYVTGLATFVVVLACASPEPLAGAVFSPLLRRFAACIAAVVVLIHAVTGWFAFYSLSSAFTSTPERWTQQLADKVYSLQRHPIWGYDAELVIAIHLMPFGEPIKYKRELLERMAVYRPYGPILLKLAMMRALQGEKDKALQTIEMMIPTYPGLLRPFLIFVAELPETAFEPIKQRLAKAVIALEQEKAKEREKAAAAPAPVKP